MSGSTTINFDDLFEALIWVSSDGGLEHEAYVSRRIGKIYWMGMSEFGIQEELPQDIGDPDLYVALPHKNDLYLGRDLVFRFAEEHLPDSCDPVYDFFRKRGAYARFKDLLDRKGQLEHWHDYENKATEQALREWCEENDLDIAAA